MQRGKDIAAKFPGLFLVHHNVPGSFIPAHAHPEHHLIIPLQGEISIDLSERSLSCGPGRMIYVAPYIEHSFRSAREKGERLICLIDDQIWKKVWAETYLSNILPASQLSKEILFYLLLNVQSVSAPALIEAFIQTLAEILAAGTLGTTSTLDHIGSSTTRAELRKAIVHARERSAEGLTVSELAKKSGLSVRNLSRLCQIDLGCSPRQLLMAFRIEKAKEHLLQGMTVTETSFAVGYSSLSQFISSFRQLTGFLPSEFSRTGHFGPKPK